MKYRFIYLAVSLFFLIFGAYGIIKWGFKLGVDFTGGAVVEYKFENSVSTEEINNKLSQKGFPVNSIQKAGIDNYLFRFPPLEREEKEKVTLALEEILGSSVKELRFENVGPSIGPELIRKTVIAMLLSTIVILLWVALQFKSFKFGTSAILAMFHDSLILIGSFSILGHFFNTEVDFLFVTALLTTLSFSVHDTIVVYDRIREYQKKEGGLLKDLADRAVSETMVRSLNNSFTILFMLVALILLGGTTVRWFAVALLIGTIAGTYSSPFVAVSLLVSFDELNSYLKKNNILQKILKK
ncbi:protein translocase subunit SecF [Patescibacteria group bacterium]|nr:protein translocase subunit SecF [Patescibacteria group bacterium]